MDIKKINEELSKMLEDGGFALSGTASEVTDLINKLAQEYGDLTIPEFIDKLIEKEKNGENILNESYNGFGDQFDFEYITDSDAFVQTLKSASFKNIQLDVGSTNSYRDYNVRITAQDIHDRKEYIMFGNDLYIREGRKSDNSVELKIYTRSQDLYPSGNTCIKFAKNHFNDSFVLYNTKNYVLCKGVYSKEYDLEDMMKDLALKFIEKIKLLDSELTKTHQSLDSEVQELTNIKQQVQDKTITVAKALSKTAVIKKIQSLQNPTPEQLARILAAIEG